MSTRIAVVGAGLAGLTAANYLIDAGRQVTLFERRTEPGGRAASSDHDGYRFNQGPHALYRGGPAESVLAELGIAYSGHDPIQAMPLGLRAGELHRLPGTATNLIRTELLGPRQKLALASLVGRLGRLHTAAAGQTVNQWIAGRTEDPALADLLRGLFRLSTYANAPDHLDAGAAIKQLASASSAGVLYLDGGWQSLANGLAQRAAARGATFETAAVDDLEDLWDAFGGAVVAVGSPAATAAVTNSPVSEAEAGPAVTAAVLELGVTRVPEVRVIVGLDEPLYASVHAPPTDLAPAGHAVVCLARYLAPGQDHDAEATKQQLLALAGRMGIESDAIAVSRYLHRMTVTHGLPLATRRGLAGRPSVGMVGDPRVAVAGDWVGPEGMLADASFASGREAARSLLEASTAVAA